jgi:hypothetical protein
MISIKLDTDAWTRTVDRLGNRAPAAIARAENRTGVNVRAAMVPAIAADMGISAARVRSRIDLRNATPNRLVMTIGASARQLPLVEFGARGPVPSRGKGTGVTTTNPGGAKRYPHAFLATVRIGDPAQRYGVFERKGRARMPIRQLYGPSIWHVFGKHEALGQARATEMFPKNLEHEIAFEASKGASV